MRMRFPLTSTQWQLPVTALAAPKNVSFMGHLLCFFGHLHSTPWPPPCKGIPESLHFVLRRRRTRRFSPAGPFFIYSDRLR